MFCACQFFSSTNWTVTLPGRRFSWAKTFLPGSQRTLQCRGAADAARLQPEGGRRGGRPPRPPTFPPERVPGRARGRRGKVRPQGGGPRERTERPADRAGAA